MSLSWGPRLFQNPLMKRRIINAVLVLSIAVMPILVYEAFKNEEVAALAGGFWVVAVYAVRNLLIERDHVDTN